MLDKVTEAIRESKQQANQALIKAREAEELAKAARQIYFDCKKWLEEAKNG